MQALVAALMVLALAAILRRFVLRDASGQVRLPRVVDESVGMFILRRLAGRSTDRFVDPFARYRRPSTVIARRPGAARPIAAVAPPPQDEPASSFRRSRQSRWARSVQYAALVIGVAIGGLAVGAAAGLAAGPNTPATGGVPAGSALRSSPPTGSPPAASSR